MLAWADAVRLCDEAIAGYRRGGGPDAFKKFWSEAGNGNYYFRGVDGYTPEARKLPFNELPSPYTKFLRAVRDTHDPFSQRVMLLSLIHTHGGNTT